MAQSEQVSLKDLDAGPKPQNFGLKSYVSLDADILSYRWIALCGFSWLAIGISIIYHACVMDETPMVLTIAAIIVISFMAFLGGMLFGCITNEIYHMARIFLVAHGSKSGQYRNYRKLEFEHIIKERVVGIGLDAYIEQKNVSRKIARKFKIAWYSIGGIFALPGIAGFCHDGRRNAILYCIVFFVSSVIVVSGIAHSFYLARQRKMEDEALSRILEKQTASRDAQ